MSNISAYFDNAATTKVSEKALEAMLPYLREDYGNPSSVYTLGREAAKAVAKAREQVATALNCGPSEIFFTGSGTEANNWVLHGKQRVITSEFEHHAVLHAVKDPILLPVYDNGIVKVADLAAAITPETDMVSVMFANNEIGTIQPIAEIGAICRERGVLMHTDAVQAVGNVPIDVQALNVDFLSLSSHKFHGPKGVGALYVRKAVQKSLKPFLQGGAQESGRRAGTENVAGIVGLGAALEEAVAGLDAKNAALLAKRTRIYDAIMSLPKVRLNGALGSFDGCAVDRLRLANNLNFSFEGIEGEALLLQLDMNGVFASSGSACTSGSLDPSHVLLALGLPHEIAHGSLRITMSRYTTDAEVDLLLEVLPRVVEKLRAMSPIWEW